MNNIVNLTKIVVNLQVEGLHYWANCPFKDVSFLRNEHRHIFHICAKKEVSHEDRDIEIIRFKRSIEQYLETKYGYPCVFGGMSCEMIAHELVDEFGLSYCQVLEDGENGAEIESIPESQEWLEHFKM